VAKGGTGMDPAVFMIIVLVLIISCVGITVAAH
jgi:hypothetical protein